MVPLLLASGKGCRASSACWVARCTPGLAWECFSSARSLGAQCPPMPNATTALLLLVTQLVSVQDPEAMAKTVLSSPVSWEQRGKKK